MVEADFTKDRFEFRSAGEDMTSVYGISFGIGILGAMGAALAFTVLLAVVDARGGEAVVTAVMIASGIAGLLMAVQFVRWRKRILRERMLVIDRDGITHVARAGRAELARWSDIEQVEEVEEDSDETFRYVLRIQRKGARDWRFSWTDFADYPTIKLLIRQRLPDRARFAVQPGQPG